MSGHSAAEINKHVKTYIGVFFTLMVLTLITVAVAGLDLSVQASISLALFIAAIKASLVAGFFMHLISEKKLILHVMALTVAFFVFLLLIPVITNADQALS